MNKTEDDTYNLIEEIALDNFQWSAERGQPKWVGHKLEVDALTLLSAKDRCYDPKTRPNEC